MTWTKVELSILKDHYGRIPASRIADELLPDRTTVAVHKMARKLGLKADRLKMTSIAKKVHSCNQHYFNASYVSNDSCYWAGFIAADGTIYNKNNSLKIELCEQDYSHLSTFVEGISFTGTVKIYNRNNSCYVTLYGFPQLLSDLREVFSITARKSRTLQPPNLYHENYIRSFIRGYFDGDGSIARVSKGDTWRASITSGSRVFLVWIQYVLAGFLPAVQCGLYSDREHFQLVFGGVRQALLFLDWIYQDSTEETRLDRKYSRYIELKNRCEVIDGSKSSMYRGVSFCNTRNKWEAKLEKDGKTIHAGRFDTEREAAFAYNAKARELGLEKRCYEMI